jgi:hypothetical protein
VRCLVALICICVGLAAGGGHTGDVLGTGFAYDAGHDVLPDWLWDAGIPGNPQVR